MSEFSKMFENNLINSQNGYINETDNKLKNVTVEKDVKMIEHKRERTDAK
jgi:hypothetical protein